MSLHCAYPPIPPEDVRPWLVIRRTLERRQGMRHGRVDLLAIVVVVALAVATGWWAGPRIDIQVSGLIRLPEQFGFVYDMNPNRRLVGYSPPTALTTDDVEVERR